jgi:hypothetical protein
MSWARLALAALASGMASSLTDWFFMGDLLYNIFNKHPEIWRHPYDEDASKAIAWSVPLPFLTCTIFVIACA